jgi:UDPglucose 6-dehydrogenase
MAEEKGLEPRILNSVMDVNYNRRGDAVRRLGEMVGGLEGKTIGLLGLAFKPNTDDMREAPSIDIVEALQQAGAKIRAYDPVAMEVARGLLPGIQFCEDSYELARGCDALMVITEWNEFKQLDLEQIRGLLKQPVIFDGRNIYDPAQMKDLGYSYRGIGRGLEVA